MATVEDDERIEELGSLEAIYPELVSDHITFTASLELAVAPSKPLAVGFLPTATSGQSEFSQPEILRIEEQKVQLSHLPPLYLQITLPTGYPADSPPQVKLSSKHNWLPKGKLEELSEQAAKEWEEYGHCQIVFLYIDFLQQAADRGFDLDDSSPVRCLVLPTALKSELLKFDEETKLEVFRQGTYDCGICLEPKKGSSCWKMTKCGHVFCLGCLKDFYNSAITEGDVQGVRCLDPTCGKDADGARKRKRKTERTVHPRELLAMGMEESMVRRYVELKRKKKIEADKTTVYCPRTWCQNPAKSPKYPPIPADLSRCTSHDSDTEESDSENNDTPNSQRKPAAAPPDPTDRLAVCEKCALAFCKVCYMGWHGPFARCYPRDPNELSAEEKASYDYIRMNTSPCPTCSSPTQKTMGCNHMKCFQCNTHFCYLCGAWLDGNNPYQHFNKSGTDCYQRLWELEEGDQGQNPGDGRGFGGGRGWEQMAIEVAREADEREAEEARQEMQRAREEDRIANELLMAQQQQQQQEPLAVRMAEVHLDVDAGQRAAQQRPPRGRRQNPFAARPPADGRAQAIRNHERVAGQRGNRGARGGGRGGRRPAAVTDEQRDEREQAELQRFLEMARRDEEDGWDSDELGDDDGRFEIR
ncbi:RWD-domain-containing protein [Hortaea werneckii]|nr:RWD-domain-containing protein [Hortaea werneckii]